jgi:hypothetical protein
MPRLAAPPALQRFVEDELARAPMVFDAAVQPVLDSLQRGMAGATGAERQVLADLILRLSSQRQRAADRYAESLADQARAEMRGGVGAEPRGSGAITLSGGLSLVDDAEVAVDVALSHAIEAIKSVAEHELRELLAYTSALVGDPDVSADYNPLRAEAHARALWAAAGALPLSSEHHQAFMRLAALPLAQTLRKAYSAACERLDRQGVQPAKYRTVIPPSGTRTMRPNNDGFGMVSAATGVPGQSFRPTDTGVPSASATAGADALPLGTVDSLARLFAVLLEDRGLPTELHGLLSRLQGLAVQAAASDPELAQDMEHPLWRLTDLFLHLGAVDAGRDNGDNASLVHFTGKLCDQLVAEPRQTRTLHAWALERLQQFASRRLMERTTAAQPLVRQMQALEARLGGDGPISTFHGALDASQLDTVPADLIDTDHANTTPPEASRRWLLALLPGEWLRMFRKGRWLPCQLLWAGDRGELFLLTDATQAEPWAMRRSALQRLREEGLVEALPASGFVRAAATRAARRAA